MYVMFVLSLSGEIGAGWSELTNVRERLLALSANSFW